MTKYPSNSLSPVVHRIALAGLMLMSSMAAAAESVFPEEYALADQTLEKRGEYRYVYRMFFKLYDAALFCPPNTAIREILNAEVPFHLEFRYLREIDKAIILKSADKILDRNLERTERSQIQQRVDAINRAYRTVGAGDRSALTYQPSVGTILTINQKPVATIEGQDFAQLYFTIWLGEAALSQTMKATLLGQD